MLLFENYLIQKAIWKQ